MEQVDVYDLILLSRLEHLENNTKCTTLVFVNLMGITEQVTRWDNDEQVLKWVLELTDRTGERVELTLEDSDVEDKIRESTAQDKTILLLQNVPKDEYAGYPSLNSSRRTFVSEEPKQLPQHAAIQEYADQTFTNKMSIS